MKIINMFNSKGTASKKQGRERRSESEKVSKRHTRGTERWFHIHRCENCDRRTVLGNGQKSPLPGFVRHQEY